MKENKKIIFMSITFSALLIITIIVYFLSDGKFSKYNDDEDIPYQLGDNEIRDFDSFFKPLLKESLDGDIDEDEYEIELFNYFYLLESPDKTESMKLRKVNALRAYAVTESSKQINKILKPLLMDLVKNNNREVTQNERELMVRSGVPRLEVDQYIQEVRDLYKNESCDLMGSLGKKGVTFDNGEPNIQNLRLTLYDISQDHCLYHASSIMFGLGIIESINRREAYPVGDFVILYSTNSGTQSNYVVHKDKYAAEVKEMLNDFNSKLDDYNIEYQKLKNTWTSFLTNVPAKFDKATKGIWNDLMRLKMKLTSYGVNKELREKLEEAMNNKMTLAREAETLSKHIIYITTGVGIAGIVGIAAGLLYLGPVGLLTAAVNQTTVLSSLAMFTICTILGGVVDPALDALRISYIQGTPWWKEFVKVFPDKFKQSLKMATYMSFIPLGAGIFSRMIVAPVLAGSLTVSSEIATLAYTNVSAWISYAFLTTFSIGAVSSEVNAANAYAQAWKYDDLYARTGEQKYLEKSLEYSTLTTELVQDSGMNFFFAISGFKALRRKAKTVEETKDSVALDREYLTDKKSKNSQSGKSSSEGRSLYDRYKQDPDRVLVECL